LLDPHKYRRQINSRIYETEMLPGTQQP